MTDYTKELTRNSFRSDDAYKVYINTLRELSKYREYYINHE